MIESVEGADLAGAIQVRSAAQGLVFAARRSLRIFGRRDEVVVLMEPVRHPLADVARHVQRAVRTGPQRVAIGRKGRAQIQVEVGAAFVGRIVPPGVGASVGAARGLLPFGLGRQSAFRPATIAVCRVPGDVDHGMVGVF